MISHEQTAYVNGRFICETGRLISDLIEVSDVFNINGFLVTMDIEKTFDSLNHSFLLAVLKKFGFGTSFINWIETILNKPESCVINSGKTTQYFQLNRGARQGDPISAYLFILVMEVLFTLIKNNEKIQGLDILNYRFLYSAHADDSTFFLRNIDSVIELARTFKEFSSFSDLSPNMSKCEIAGIGSLKGVEIAVCGMKNIDLTKDAVKIIGISFSYNKAIQNELNFRTTISKIQAVLQLWRMRRLSLEGKIIVFKSLAISKIVYLSLLTNVPYNIVEELKKNQKNFLWNFTAPKIKHSTTRMDYQNGGLKNVDVFFKIISLQCSWFRRLFDNSFHQWKVIPLFFINKTFGEHFKFHSNLDFSDDTVKCFPSFYKSMFLNWKKFFYVNPCVPSCILNQVLWLNKVIQINRKPVFYKKFSLNNVNFLMQLVDKNGSCKNWYTVKHEYDLQNNLYFQWMQLVNAIPSNWKNIIKQKYFEKKFTDLSLDWKEIYMIPRIVSSNTYMRCFQYEVLNNTLFLNKKLFLFKKSNSPLCSFCNEEDETIFHLYFYCPNVRNLWNQLDFYLAEDFLLPPQTPQAAVFGFSEKDNTENLILCNHLFLIFKLYVYRSREKGLLNVMSLVNQIIKIKKNEKENSLYSEKKRARYIKKWSKTDLKFVV